MQVTGFLGNTWAIVCLVVAALSGSLAVVREVQLMYLPAKSSEKKTFWAFVRVAFIAAAIMLWLDERAKINQLSERLNFNLKPRIDSVAVAPAGNHSENSVVTVIGDILNPSGPPTIAEDWKMSVHCSDGTVSTGEPIALPDSDLVLGSSRPNEPTRILSRNEYWPTHAAKQVIPTGGAFPGWVTMLIRCEEQKIAHNGAEIKVSFRDVSGKQYSFSRRMTGVPAALNWWQDLQPGR